MDGLRDEGSRIRTSSVGKGRGAVLVDAKFATLHWMWRFNHHRLLEPIGDVPLVEDEERFYRQPRERVF
jgi:hypothetical protein